MLIIALVLAAIGLAALVFAVVTSNALVAWVCIGASLLGVLLLIADALRERRAVAAAAAGATADESEGSEVPVDAVADAEDDAVFAESYDTYEAADAQAAEAAEAAEAVEVVDDVPALEHDDAVDAVAHDVVVADAEERPAD